MRGKGKAKLPCKVSVIGAGTMGPGIAQVFAAATCSVTLIDIDVAALEQAKDRIKSSVNAFREARIYSIRKASGVLSNISFTTGLAEGVKSADFIVEAIPENLEAKKALFRRIEKLAPPEAIIASNTSTFSINDLASGSKRCGKYILTHFVIPPQVIPLVEVARGEGTDDETFAFTLALLKQAGKRPLLLKKMIPGHLINNFNFAIFSTAIEFLDKGIVASAEDIDLALTAALGPRYAVMGPFKTMDMIGLNIAWQVVSSFDPNAHSDPRIKRIKELYEAGKLGMRTGAGFYDYSDKPYFDTLNYYDRKIIETYKTAHKG
jgi:3-hydroxybutyryl-CoA dehydrogenase